MPNMPVPAGCTHVKFGGASAQGERWETGFWMFKDFATPITANAAALAAYNSLVGTGDLFTVLKASLYSDTTLSYVRLYAYSTTGTKSTTIGEYLPATPVPGTSGSATILPLQVAAVVTLRTAQPGRRGRGRMYLPFNVPGGAPGGQGNLGTFQSITNALKKTINDMQATTEWTGGRMIVVSQTGTTSADVLKLTMDTRFDVQRRRANKQAVTGTASTVGP